MSISFQLLDGILRNPDKLESILSSHRPLSLWSAKMEDKGGEGSKDVRGRTWADVGGLDQVRRIFEETILWPAKYPGRGWTSLSANAFGGGIIFIS